MPGLTRTPPPTRMRPRPPSDSARPCGAPHAPAGQPLRPNPLDSGPPTPPHTPGQPPFVYGRGRTRLAAPWAPTHTAHANPPYAGGPPRACPGTWPHCREPFGPAHGGRAHARVRPRAGRPMRRPPLKRSPRACAATGAPLAPALQRQQPPGAPAPPVTQHCQLVSAARKRRHQCSRSPRRCAHPAGPRRRRCGASLLASTTAIRISSPALGPRPTHTHSSDGASPVSNLTPAAGAPPTWRATGEGHPSCTGQPARARSRAPSLTPRPLSQLHPPHPACCQRPCGFESAFDASHLTCLPVRLACLLARLFVCLLASARESVTHIGLCRRQTQHCCRACVRARARGAASSAAILAPERHRVPDRGHLWDAKGRRTPCALVTRAAPSPAGARGLHRAQRPGAAAAAVCAVAGRQVCWGRCCCRRERRLLEPLQLARRRHALHPAGARGMHAYTHLAGAPAWACA